MVDAQIMTIESERALLIIFVGGLARVWSCRAQQRGLRGPCSSVIGLYKRVIVDSTMRLVGGLPRGRSYESSRWLSQPQQMNSPVWHSIYIQHIIIYSQHVLHSCPLLSNRASGAETAISTNRVASISLSFFLSGNSLFASLRFAQARGYDTIHAMSSTLASVRRHAGWQHHSCHFCAVEQPGVAQQKLGRVALTT